jgi:hypothetical protein
MLLVTTREQCKLQRVIGWDMEVIRSTPISKVAQIRAKPPSMDGRPGLSAVQGREKRF